MEYNGYRIEHDGSFGMYVIRPLGKGSTPKNLKGRFTSYGAAQHAIDASNKMRKGIKDGENDSSGRG